MARGEAANRVHLLTPTTLRPRTLMIMTPDPMMSSGSKAIESC
jgi:hypothetical protein